MNVEYITNVGLGDIVEICNNLIRLSCNDLNRQNPNPDYTTFAIKWIIIILVREILRETMFRVLRILRRVVCKNFMNWDFRMLQNGSDSGGINETTLNNSETKKSLRWEHEIWHFLHLTLTLVKRFILLTFIFYTNV